MKLSSSEVARFIDLAKMQGIELAAEDAKLEAEQFANLVLDILQNKASEEQPP